MGFAKRRAGRARAANHRRSGRRKVLLGGMLLFALLLTLTAFRVAVMEHDAWLDRASEQHADQMELPAPRGTIYDRDGVPLAASRQVYRLAIAPREVVDAEALARKLRRQAGLGAAEAKRALAEDRKWRVLRGRYDETVKEELDGIAGVHFQQVMQRFYPHGALAAELLGTVNSVGDALGGIELEFDSLLSGTPGLAVVRHRPNGRPIPGMMLRVTEPVPGRDVRLTIDYELQAIADDALRQALTATRAAGGELLMLDPRTGEVLAAVSRRGAGGASNWSAVTSPYEPGSTIKPFTVAAVLSQRRATLADSIYGEQGRYPLHGRVITDVHPHGWVTLAEGLRESSNVVMAKAGSRMTPEEHYRYLRDFGFGTPTGVPYPSESGGLLRRPPQWSRQSAASLSIGYEISVTALQMALAYGALANGGVLMEPRLVREVRSREGRVEQAFPPRAVRRVLSETVANQIREVLVDAVETGTGHAASMGPMKVGGKTGTARLALSGRYVQGAYTSTFAGFFPATNPQLVFVVRLDQPKGAYYGGAVAAPVTRATLEAALAARGTPIDRRAVARRAFRSMFATGAGKTREAPVQAPIGAPSLSPPVTPISTPISFVSAPASPAAARVVPDVGGDPMRDAVRSLHAAGFRVRLVGKGRVRETVPPAGVKLEAGGVVQVYGSMQEQ